MNVTCPECRSIFRVDPAKVPAGGVRARCAVCGGVMPVAAPGAFVGAPGDTPVRSSVAIPPRGADARVAPPAPSAPSRMPTPAPAAVAMPTPTTVPAAPPSPPPSVPPWTPAEARAVAPAPPVPAAPVEPAASAAFGGGGASPAPRPSGGTSRTINPFLANDPNQKAKRLARALVSDILAYHPQLRDPAMRDGALQQLFRDEVKKSYEEYVDQVGKAFAETTPHFQDAVNEVLGGGSKVV